MVLVAMKCPNCGSDKVGKYGTSNGKQRYICRNSECTHQTVYDEYTNKGYKPEIKLSIIQMATDGVGIRATARLLGISTDTVMPELKKRRFDRLCEQRRFFLHMKT